MINCILVKLLVAFMSTSSTYFQHKLQLYSSIIYIVRWYAIDFFVSELVVYLALSSEQKGYINDKYLEDWRRPTEDWYKYKGLEGSGWWVKGSGVAIR